MAMEAGDKSMDGEEMMVPQESTDDKDTAVPESSAGEELTESEGVNGATPLNSNTSKPAWYLSKLQRERSKRAGAAQAAGCCLRSYTRRAHAETQNHITKEAHRVIESTASRVVEEIKKITGSSCSSSGELRTNIALMQKTLQDKVAEERSVKANSKKTSSSKPSNLLPEEKQAKKDEKSARDAERKAKKQAQDEERKAKKQAQDEERKAKKAKMDDAKARLAEAKKALKALKGGDVKEQKSSEAPPEKSEDEQKLEDDHKGGMIANLFVKRRA